MFRDLQAIEIAEGALLADIAVVFQLLVIYLPVVGDVFRLPIFIIFAILVLRRGLYVGLMSFCVTLLVCMIVLGLNGVSTLLLEVAGGLFLGMTMKYRLRHIPSILLGVTCGALAMYGLVFFLLFLTAQPLDSLVLGLHRSYTLFMPLVSAVAVRLGLGVWWQGHGYPMISSFATLAFKYWWALIYIVFWIILCPVVSTIYMLTNISVRLFGYDVRPFPDGRLRRLLRRGARRLLRIGVKRGILKRTGVRV